MLALGAVKLAPTLVPAAALAGRLLGEAGELRQAARIIETAWRANPHPDLAETYAHLRPGDSARDRLARVQTLTREPAAHVEGALAVARAALDAREFAIARAALTPLAAAPTQRVAMLFARLEEMEHGDEGRAREWMTRAVRAHRDPVWTADGFVSDRWMPVSPVTGRLDAFVWMEPLAQIGAAAGDVIEAGDEPAAIEAAPAVRPTPPAPEIAAATTAPASAPISPAPAPEPAPAPNTRNAAAATPAVIPLIHAPDDPGPDGEPHADPVPDAPPPQPNGWDRLRALFK
jgi:HemY protein